MLATKCTQKPSTARKKVRILLPKEHGTWMMFFLPYFLGTMIIGLTTFHIPFLIGWFFLFLASTPLFSIIRNQKVIGKMLPWLVSYSIIALVILIPIIWHYPILLVLGIILVPLLAINLYFIKKKNERSLLNNISGIITFGLGGVAAVILGGGSILDEAIFLLLYVTFYFTGSAFYVKSLIRERKNHRFRIISHTYHVLLLLVPVLIGQPLLAVAYFPGSVKDWITTRKKQMKPMQIGIIEIVNGIVFFVLSLAFFL
ncbi:YwiC-like family protein [Alkalihalobacillus sp. MEB130]|uniref:YwiC-like family protein n=1 Tax=Alkalihalobacillus sp. MEB130 TaxID=2976704 RepID=UPI0028DFF1E2|nr:YwiC-like family protein [Alkalihalobacillus sp. MEB130]MDT8861314.1 YwiC-like family protein [Alkalihalobacillus sp. MEB130]